ncbi:DNA polymerase I [cf. Phormidesmis sp. LEGE 11477]|nr:DNA polymerase I [cf. Phormidesmis sp. LEGE 11477]MBE9060796.1 DNA polymerase I [cf. Phormidesmis sp. LEGE 11477]
MLVDGHSLAFRSYYAFARSRDGGLRTSTGIPTSVCFGFLKSLMDNLEAQQPDYAAITFDLSEPTFRHEITDTYKAGRAETPEEFTEDVENLKALLGAFQLPIFSLSGYEADDMIGTLAVRAKAKGYCVKILSGDQDLFQLIDPEEAIKVMYLSTTFGSKTSTTKEYGNAEVLEKLSILPSQVVDYKALCGDTSDNIPGVKGIGKKTAVKLLDTYGDLETIYASIDELKGAVKKRLETGKEDAAQSKRLAKIKTDVPLETDLETCKLEGFNPEDVIPALKRLELQHFVNRLSKLQASFGGESDYQPRPKTVSIVEELPEGFEDPDLAFFSAEETDAVASMGLDSVDIQPLVVTTEQQLKQLVKTLKTQTNAEQPVAWDTETNSIDPLEADLVGIGCCWGEGSTDLAYIPIGHTVGEQLGAEAVLNALKPILEDEKYPKAFQNAKYDRLVLRRAGVTLAGVVFDPMLASYVLNPENSHNLSDLALRYLELTTVGYTDLVPKGKTIGEIAIAKVAQYCGSDVHTTYRLVPLLKAELKESTELAALYADVELPVEPVLATMEATGIRIDKDYLDKFSKQLESDLATIEKSAYEAAGEAFNLGSPKQLSELFFEKLGLDKRKSRKNKTGYSTDAATLEKLQGDHPVVDSVVEYRTLSKLKSTYVDALPALIRPNTGRVHTDFNQAVTTTGRLSSSNPNLQNIPTRTAFSRQIRQAFLPKEGWQLVAADYSQIELRILAHLSEEPILIKTYREDEDVHRLTATLLFDKDKDEITPEQRRMAKVINFGVIYGMGAARFAREMDIHRLDAKTFIDRFNQRYPNVFEYLQQMQREAIAHGYVKTIAGRRRYFNFTTRSLQALRGTDPQEIDLSSLRTNGYDAGSLRAAANAPIQGSSADIIKIAMIRLHDLLKDYQANMLLQVHDELIFEVPPDEWEVLQPKIEQTMENAVQLAVPLKVEAQAGKNWMDAK